MTQKPSQIEIVFLGVRCAREFSCPNNGVFFIRGREARVGNSVVLAIFGMVRRGNPLTCPYSIVGFILRPVPGE